MSWMRVFFAATLVLAGSSRSSSLSSRFHATGFHVHPLPCLWQSYTGVQGRPTLCTRNMLPSLGLRMLEERSDDVALPQRVRPTRRFIIQTAAGTAALTLNVLFSPLKHPAFAEGDARIDSTPALPSKVRAARLYDLGLDTIYNRAPGKVIVLADTVVEKSPADDKFYRAMTLANGLRVLLTSDSKADTAAAALNVRVGHFSDPDYLPGLAHFCEHMLFLGTAKYPREGELETFLARNAGRSNAFTGNEETCYYFTVNQDSLEGALDIYSQFFVAPLFSASGVEREINAVNSENAKNLNTDSWRISQTLKLRNNQLHPIAKFGTGNNETLARTPKKAGVDVQKELRSFYKRYYSANQMTLAVSGRQDLDTLQSWVTDLFSQVPNTDVPPAEAEYAGKISPIQPGAEDFVFGVVPVQDIRSLDLTWQVPFTSGEDREMRTLAKPHQVVGALLNYEGKGSLAAYLKNELRLVNSLVWSFSRTSDIEEFSMSMGLTEDGLARKQDIIGVVFSYLDFVREHGVPKHILDQVTQLADIFWRFKESDGPRAVIGHASNMHKYLNPRDWLTGPSLIKNLEMAEVMRLLEALTLEDVLVSYVSQDIKHSADKTEKWYGTKYERTKIDKLLCTQNKFLNPSLPQANLFIPTNFQLQNTLLETSPREPTPPNLMMDSQTWRIFTKADRTYGKPRAFAYFNIALPDDVLGSRTSPRTSALCRLYDLMLSDSLTESTYDASLAGLSYSFGLTQRGVLLSMSGFNDKLSPFINTVATAVVEYVPSDEAKLTKFKDVLRRNLRAFAFQQPYQHASAYAQECLMLPGYLPDDVLQEVDSITLGELQKWAKGLWKYGFGQALIQGNIKEEEALQSAMSVAKAFNLKPLPEDKRGAPKNIQLPLVSATYGSVLQRKEPNPDNVNSAVLVQFQNGDRDNLKQQLAMEVLGSIIANPFFTELRTKQQLGYIVNGGVSNREGVRSLVFSVQSSVADSAFLTEKIFEFLDSFSLDMISDARIDSYIQGIVAKKQERDKRLGTEVGRHWSEIVIGRYDYTRVKREAEIMKKLTRADLDEALSNIVLPGGAGRRVLTTQVSSSTPILSSSATATKPKSGVIISSVKEFVAKNSIFPPFKGSPGTKVENRIFPA